MRVRDASIMMSIMAVAIIVAVMLTLKFAYPTTGTTQTQSSLGTQAGQLGGSCPTDGDSSVIVNVYNKLNTSGTENYDTTFYILNEDGSIETSGTDTTSPSAVTIDCGRNYELVVVASDSDGGDNTKIISSNIGTVTSKGTVKFKADQSNMNFRLMMSQHGVLQFKIYDNEDARYAYDTGDADNTAWEADGTTFTDGDNTTAFAVGVGGYVDFTIKIQGTGVDTDNQDQYILIAVEAPVTEWDEPSVRFNGGKLTDIKDTGLNSDEVKGLSSYEYVYKISDNLEDDINSLDFYMQATGSANPSTDLQIDLFPAGWYLQTGGQTLAVSASQNDASKTVVYTTQDITVDIS